MGEKCYGDGDFVVVTVHGGGGRTCRVSGRGGGASGSSPVPVSKADGEDQF